MNVSNTGYLFCYVSQIQHRIVMSTACADWESQQDQDLIPYTDHNICKLNNEQQHQQQCRVF